jgi:hypothetical protein
MPKSRNKPRGKANTGKVGYRKPPIEHRFKPGQSGNPRGRPKVLPELSELTAKELRRRRQVVIDGKNVSVTMLELVVKKLIASAAQANSKSLNFLLEMTAKYEAKQRKEATLSRGTTIHSGMSAKEAMDEYVRWLKETNHEIYDE